MPTQDLSRAFEEVARRVKQGRPILKSLEKARRGCVDPRAATVMEAVFHQVASGQSLWDPIKPLDLPPSARQFIYRVETSEEPMDVANIFESFARMLAEAHDEEAGPGGQR